MAPTKSRTLILCKTYPSPSTKYAETSCVAGVSAAGQLIRLFPVPFRLISSGQQFKKWQWITAYTEKARDDHRPESHKIKTDTIACDPDALPTDEGWAQRRACLAQVPVHGDFASLDAERLAKGSTLGLLRPARIVGLQIKPAKDQDWTDDERKKLIQMEQPSLFDAADKRSIAELRKVPFNFYYRYECSSAAGTVALKHKIVDWEACALYWNVVKRHGSNWEKPLRDKLEGYLPKQDLMFLMGTMHRWPDKWLIVSLIYPPKPQLSAQGSLL